MTFIKRKDLLNILLTASVVESDGRKAGKLSEEEIVAQSIGFMLAGFDGTSTSLASICFLLAMNPEEQEKVYQEIQAKLPKDVSNRQKSYNVRNTQTKVSVIGIGITLF